MHRRTLIQSLLAGLLACLSPAFRPRTAAADVSSGAFLHGIASGDPSADSVILWTRVSGFPERTRRLPVRWQVAEDADMTQLVAEGTTRTDARRDFTVKVDAARLPAGRTLFYRFRAGAELSAVGRTRTLPVGEVAAATFAVVSCSNHPAGYFHAYREIAQRDELDAVLHLGDYLYEYGMGEYATEHAAELGRVPEPATECRSLGDYRRRHAQYKRDADSQAMHAAHPLIAIWDDHEIANDAWPDGARNHQPEEGRWRTRRDAAVKAWFEWMPVRGEPAEPIFRDFRYGDLAHLIMLDTRLHGRDVQADVGENVTPESIAAALEDPDRRLLGRRQERWLRSRLEKARGAVWQILGQQVMTAEMRSPDLAPVVDPDGPSFLTRERLDEIIARSKGNPPTLLDTWDGYPRARKDLLQDLARLAKNPVILSGDLHSAMAAELSLPGAGRPVAIEFMTTSVTSPGITAALPEKWPNALRDATLRQNPGLKFLDLHHRGWLCLSVTPDRCTGDWHFLDGVRRWDCLSRPAHTLSIEAGKIDTGLQNQAAPGSATAASA